MSSVEFFSPQFDRPIAAADDRLNAFETWTLPHLAGHVLGPVCGRGNLSSEAARRGHCITALDACPHAVAHLARRALAEVLSIAVEETDLSEWRSTRTWDSVIATGLPMFFACDDARRVLQQIRRAVRPGGIAAVTVLVEGTTAMQRFDPGQHCLFPPGELSMSFADWTCVWIALMASMRLADCRGVSLR
jgi:tellurite methyltransferase